MGVIVEEAEYLRRPGEVPENNFVLGADTETVHWGYFDPTIPPALEVDSGSVVTIETISGEPEDLPSDGKFDVLPDHRAVLEQSQRGPGPHLLTGPVHVRGALPGDVLAVEILDISLRQDWGWNKILPLIGSLPDEFPDTVRRIIPINLESKTATLPWGQELALAPFFGVMGVAPPANWGRINSIQPRGHGGNMDNKEMRPGTTVYFPVFRAGALFSIGDGHAIQGDGEVCVSALETALTGTFRFSVLKGRKLHAPRAENAESWITMGFDEDLDDALKQALRGMIEWVQEVQGLSRVDAYMLCSLIADMRITQNVNEIKGVHCVMPKRGINIT